MGTVRVRAGHTSPTPWAYTARALGVLGARRSHSAGPHRTNTAPSTTKRPTPEPHNRHPRGQRPCATQQVFAAQPKPSDQNRTTAKAEGPRGARREHRHGRALDAVIVTRAQQHPAVGVQTARRGRTDRSPWAYRPLALGALATRPGRTRHGPRSNSAGPHSTNAAHRRQRRSPRRARRGRRHRRAKGGVRIERGPKHASLRCLRVIDSRRGGAHRAVGVVRSPPGRTRLPPRAYSSIALAVLESRRGRTLLTPWAPSQRALGVPAHRPGHSHGARWAYQPHAVGVLPALYERAPRVLTPRTLPHQGQRGAR